MNPIAHQHIRVSVIMPVYNGARYIREAITSVRNQTYTDWELIIVNDSSTDDTEKILADQNDPRIHVFTNEKNCGSVISRNIAFEKCRGEYIAILDADDIALPTRFAEQVQFLDTHHDCGFVASWATIIDEYGKPSGQLGKEITSPEKAPIKLLFQNLYAFSSAMMRRRAMPEIPFREDSVPVEDVDLYLRMIDQWKFVTLPRTLIKYRAHDKGISKVFSEKKQHVMDRLITGQLHKLNITPTQEELKIHRTNYGYGGNDIAGFLARRHTWLMKLITQNREIKCHPPALFEEVVAEMWLASCDANARLGRTAWRTFMRSPLSKRISWIQNPKKLLQFAIKCVLGKDKIR